MSLRGLINLGERPPHGIKASRRIRQPHRCGQSLRQQHVKTHGIVVHSRSPVSPVCRMTAMPRPMPTIWDDSPPKSQTDLLDQSIGQVIAFPLVGYTPEKRAAFRAWFTAAFSQALQDRFANHEQVAAAFGVRGSTAWNWWTGDNRAMGDAVAYAFMIFPTLREEFLRRWGEEA